MKMEGVAQYLRLHDVLQHQIHKLQLRCGGVRTEGNAIATMIRTRLLRGSKRISAKIIAIGMCKMGPNTT